MKTRNYWAFMLMLFIFFLSGCDRLPDAYKQRAEAVPNSLKETKADISRQRGSFEALQKSDEWPFLKPYAEFEKWTDELSRAEVELSRASIINQNKVIPLLKKNESASAETLLVHLRSIQKSLKSARETASRPMARKEFLLKARDEAPEWVKKAKGEVSEIDVLLSQASVFVKKAKADYPAKAEDINGRFAALRKLGDDAYSALKVSEGELVKVSSGEADYAKLGDSTELISAKLAALKEQKGKLKSKLDELYRSYSKTLVDSRITYHAKIIRYSWDSWDDWDNSPDKTYNRQVDENVFAVLESGDGLIATLSKTHVPANVWNALKIDKKGDWCCGDDRAEFWVESTFTKTYHKYSIVENGVQKDTDDWQQVNENTYWAHEESLGMTIVSKPYGMYEEEILQSAAPPGMEYIAKPTMKGDRATGSNQYGEWKQDSSGNSFWHYYGQYAFMSSLLGNNHHYYYDDWNDYSRRDRKQPYYGRTGGFGTHGHRTYENPRYKNSEVVRHNPGIVKEARASKVAGGQRTSGSTNVQKASVRNGATANKGRGASGKGGK